MSSTLWGFVFVFFSPFFFFFFFKYKHQCTINPIGGKNGPKENGSRPERTKLINNDMWLVQSANTKQTFTLSWFFFFFLLNNQEMWVSESFLLRYQSSADDVSHQAWIKTICTYLTKQSPNIQRKSCQSCGSSSVVALARSLSLSSPAKWSPSSTASLSPSVVSTLS